MLFASAAGHVGQLGPEWHLMRIDVKKAHIYGVCEEDAYVELPAEMAEEGKCAKLIHWLYGMRGAARGWEMDYQSRFWALGFAVGQHAPNLMYLPSRELRVVTRG